MSDLDAWVAQITGHTPRDPALYEQALTHSSRGGADYERLEFLGDRVLGLAMADWLLERYPGEAEGRIAQRLHALVSGPVCAEVARGLGAQAHLRLGKQAQDDGVFDSDNVLGDVMEALIGALYGEAGYEAAAAFVRRVWGDRVERLAKPPKHPKAELQEWADSKKRKPPAYTLIGTSGPHHNPRFKVSVSVNGLGEATGEGASKQEAETSAAKALLEKIGG